jgi:Haspin like kinase domain
MAHHGQDLESHSLSSWSEAAHIFWSVVRSLSQAEQEHDFEHRDLHWGNILIDRSGEDEILERLLENLNLEEGTLEQGEWGGVKVTVIDYTLSRARVEDRCGEQAWYGFLDEGLFEGKRIAVQRRRTNVGDYQFDIYRQMREMVTDEGGEAKWEDFHPRTNVLWLHYLASKLLYAKQLPTPVTRLSARNQSKGVGGRKHERSFSVILDGEDKLAYEGLFGIYGKINPKNPISSAAAVLDMGRANGWIV